MTIFRTLALSVAAALLAGGHATAADMPDPTRAKPVNAAPAAAVARARLMRQVKTREECEPGHYYMMTGPDRSTPLMCK